MVVAWLPGEGDTVGTLVYAGSRELDDKLGILARICKRDIPGFPSRSRGREDEGNLDGFSGLKGHWQREGSDGELTSLNGVGGDFQRPLAGILEVDIEGFGTASGCLAKAVLAGLTVELLSGGWN